jgi:hypothetical protein
LLYGTSFVLTIIYYPCGDQGGKRGAIIIYTTFFFLTLLPQLFFYIDGTGRMAYGDYLVEIALIPVWLGHMLATILGLLAVFIQARQILLQLSHQQQQQHQPISSPISSSVPVPALNPLSLKLQAIVFVLLAVSWPWRLHGSEETTTTPAADLPGWYSLESFNRWLVVNHAVFALGQVVLLWKASRDLSWALPLPTLIRNCVVRV